MEPEKPKSAKKQSNTSRWLIVALAFTVAYAVFFWLATEVTSDALDVSRKCNKTGLFSGMFGCLTLNELGDLFAGAFAPVAFIWLAAAVLIQSQELKAQREVLDETRAEAEATREVLSKQSNFIGKQTELLVSDSTNRAFEAMINAIGFQLRSTTAIFRSSPVPNGKMTISPISPQDPMWNQPDDRLIYYIGLNLTRHMDTGSTDFGRPHFPEYPLDLVRLQLTVNDAAQLVEQLSEPGKARAMAVGVRQLYHAVNRFMAHAQIPSRQDNETAAK